MTYDHIIIGSGINALVCGAILSRHQNILVLEREETVGGTIKTGTLAEGFTYDPLAMTYLLLLASPAYADLGEELTQRGVAFAKTDAPTGVLTAEGRAAILSTDRNANIKAFDALEPGEGERHREEMAYIEANAEFLFSLLNGQLWSLNTLKLLLRETIKRKPRGLKSLIGEMLVSNRRRLGGNSRAKELEALMAPWPLHAGLDPEQPYSGQIGMTMAFALEAFGAPISVGGAHKVAQALADIISANGGTVRTGADVDEILEGTDGRPVAGVRLAGGEELDAPSVISSTTPTQLYGRLLRHWTLPEFVAKETRRYQYGKGNMQIHYALKQPVAWPVEGLQEVQLLHLSDGIDQVSKASNEALRGVLPANPTVCVGQPTAADPSRAPEGQAVLWIQLPQCPITLLGDAAGRIDVPEDGRWNEAVREAYADRVEEMIAAHVPGFRDTVIVRKALSPADLEAANINLIGGEPYGGWSGLDQLFTFRPFPQQINHDSFAQGVYQIGASTHPGSGLGGMSGYMLAQQLKPRKRWF
ncbi:MAG: NAD(P)/FAD-dependent oxidoreductase [Pseudomonadota bacterium]